MERPERNINLNVNFDDIYVGVFQHNHLRGMAMPFYLLIYI